MEHDPRIVIKGELVYSFGQNGDGLSKDFSELAKIIEMLSEDNHVYLKDAMIDTTDDVYDLKFNIMPRSNNKWYFENGEKYCWYSTFEKKSKDTKIQNNYIDDINNEMQTSITTKTPQDYSATLTASTGNIDANVSVKYI